MVSRYESFVLFLNDNERVSMHAPEYGNLFSCNNTSKRPLKNRQNIGLNDNW